MASTDPTLTYNSSKPTTSPFAANLDVHTPWLRYEENEIVETSQPVLSDVPISECIFTVGNGIIGIRGYPEETESYTHTPYYHTGSVGAAGFLEGAGAVGGRRRRRGKGSGVVGGSNGNGGLIRAGYHNSGLNTPVSTSLGNQAGGATSKDGGAGISGGSNASSGPSRWDAFKAEAINIMLRPNPTQPIRGCYFAGFFEQRVVNKMRSASSVAVYPSDSFLVRVPDAFCIDVFLSGEHVSESTGRIVAHSRRLDLRTGELHRRMVWESHVQNREVTIESVRFASSINKNMAAERYTVTARNASNADIRITSRMELPDLTQARQCYTTENISATCSMQDATSVMVLRTRSSCRRLAAVTIETCTSRQLIEGGVYGVGGGSPNSGPGKGHPADGASLGAAANATNAEQNSGSMNDLLAGTPVGADRTAAGDRTGAVAGGSSLFTSSSLSSANFSAATPLTPQCVESDTGTETTFTSCISDHVVIELIKYVGFFGDDDGRQEELCDMAVYRTRHAANFGFDALREEHRKGMQKFWSTGDVVLSGSSLMQSALRYNILQLFMSASNNPHHAFPTRGLTGEMLGGLQQWDVDAVIVPFFSHVCPQRARTMLLFRIGTLNHARDIASDLDLPRGAVFPFRTINGCDTNTPYCSAFLFVNAIIALVMQVYLVATNDMSILKDGGLELVLATALVWLEWGTWEKNTFHLRSVSGPDLYNGLVDDNFFTNIMAQHHLVWTVQLAAYMRGSDPALWQQLLDRCHATEADIVAMERAASKMALNFDATHRINPADQSFLLKKRWIYEDLRTNVRNHLICRYDPNVIFRHQLCRIPDVMLATMLLPETFTLDDIKANLRFYEPITSQDSALRLVIYGVVASHLHLTDKAMRYFSKSLFVDLDNIIGDTGGGLHSTTAAGSWLALVIGFAGMRVVQGVIHFDPSLPNDCSGYQFHVRHRGCLLNVAVTDRLVTYTFVETSSSAEELLIIHADTNRIHLRRGGTAAVRLRHEVRVFDFSAVIFDMDSVIDNIEDMHFQAWCDALAEYMREVDVADVAITKELYLAYLCHNTPLKGLKAILAKYELPALPVGSPGDGEKAHTLHGLCNRKLGMFRVNARKNPVHVREGAFELLSNLRICGIAVGCVSGSKNGRWLLDERPDLRMLFDHILDYNDGERLGLRWRPEMDYFEACAKGLDTDPHRTIVVMDGVNGFSKNCVEHFCMVVDVGHDAEKVPLAIPIYCAENFKDLTIELLDEYTAGDAMGSNKDSMVAQQHPLSPVVTSPQGPQSNRTSPHIAPTGSANKVVIT